VRQGAHAAFHGGGKNLGDAGTLLDQLVISSRCTDALSTSSIQPFRSEQIDLLMITATIRALFECINIEFEVIDLQA